MQQPLEERVPLLEAAAQRHEQTIARLVSIAENHDQLMERLLASQETFHSNQEAIVNLLEELTRDAAITRRLWFRLAQRYGWLDDEQNGAQPETPT
jgi:hypothetical protein